MDRVSRGERDATRGCPGCQEQPPFSAEKIARLPYGPIWIVGNRHFQIVVFRSFVRFIVLKCHGI